MYREVVNHTVYSDLGAVLYANEYGCAWACVGFIKGIACAQTFSTYTMLSRFDKWDEGTSECVFVCVINVCARQYQNVICPLIFRIQEANGTESSDLKKKRRLSARFYNLYNGWFVVADALKKDLSLLVNDLLNKSHATQKKKRLIVL